MSPPSSNIVLRRVFVNAALFFALLLPLAAPHAAGAAPAGVYFPETATLSNGMQVVVSTNRRVPAVTHMVWYKVGAADEATGQYGVAHFLEHLMFKGTDKVGPGEFSRRVAQHGGNDNAFTSYDFTAYFQTVARDRLEMVMAMEADRMTGLKLTDELVKPEAQVVWEERRQRSENTPDARFSEQMRAAAYVHHPYGRPVIGWPGDIKAFNREAAEAFYKTWYAPNNAVLVVSGDAALADVLPLAEKYYGVIPAKPLPPRVRPAEPPTAVARRISMQDAEVREPELEKTWHAPSYGFDPDGHVYALQVLAEIMGGGDTARLHQALVVEQKLATETAFGYSPGALDGTMLYAAASPLPGVALADLEKALDQQIAKLTADGVTAEQLATAKRRMSARAAYALDGLAGPARALGMALTTGRTVEEVEAWPARIDAVTAEQVLAAAKAVFSGGGHVTGLLTPAETAGQEN
jgi:zinc protease